MKNELLDVLKEKTQKTQIVLKDEFNHVRAGRANPTLLDRLQVSYYGADTPIKQLASISVPEPRVLQIQPYDLSILEEIEKSIHAANLGMNPSNDGKVIRLVVPLLTEERRAELTKDVKKLGEDAKVAIRNERRHAMDDVKKMEKNNDVTEDDKVALEKNIQKIIDGAVEEIDHMVQIKNKEIMEV